MIHERWTLMMVVVLVCCLTLCGCVTDEPQDTDKTGPTEETSNLEVLTYTVVTQSYDLDRGRYETIAEGFHYTNDANRYLVSGRVKNNGTENISQAYVYIHFYNRDNVLLFTSFDMLFHVGENESKEFSADFTKYDADGFPRADHVLFSFKQEPE